MRPSSTILISLVFMLSLDAPAPAGKQTFDVVRVKYNFDFIDPRCKCMQAPSRKQKNYPANVQCNFNVFGVSAQSRCAPLRQQRFGKQKISAKSRIRTIRCKCVSPAAVRDFVAAAGARHRKSTGKYAFDVCGGILTIRFLNHGPAAVRKQVASAGAEHHKAVGKYKVDANHGIRAIRIRIRSPGTGFRQAAGRITLCTNEKSPQDCSWGLCGI